MKKFLFVFCLLLSFTLFSCQKDEEKNEKLLKQFYSEKEEDFSIPKKLKIKNKEFER